MQDYTLAIGDGNPYGFSATDDRAAMLHAADYMAEDAATADDPVVLSGPGGILTLPVETGTTFRRRVSTLHPFVTTDDIRRGDSTPPDCNGA